MSNSNTNLQTQSSNALHMHLSWKRVARSYPPMLAPDIRDQLNAKTEAVQIILTGIDNDIYSTVDACPNACEMWKAIKRLKQGESINVQDLETNLYWEFGKFTSRDGESLESYYSRFYKMMNELVRNQCHVTNHQVNVQFLLQLQPEWQRFVTLVKQSQELKTVSYHKLYDILKQHQNEVNEIRAERLARTANPLALSTRNRGKAIVTSSAPTYDPEPATVTEDEEMSKEKEIDKLMALISLSFKKIYKPTNNNLRTSSNTSRANQDNSPRINRGTGYDNQRAVNVAGARENVGTPVVQKSGIQCYNCKEYGHVSRECQKPKRVKDAAYHKEKMLLCKQEEAGVQLNAEQADWKDDTDDESDDQELEAHYMAQLQEVTPDQVDNSGPIFDDEPMHKVQNNNDNYNVFAMENEHPEQPESSNDIYLAEHGDTNITIDSLDICYDSVQDDQDENIIDLDQDKQTVTGQRPNQLMVFKDLKKFQAEIDMYNDVNYESKLVEIILFIVDSGCSKHMTGNLKLLTNFVEKFLGTVKFGNDQIAPILGYGDLVQGTITIKRVYYVEGLNHNLFSVGQFCDADLEVAFRKSTCYIHDLKGNDLLTGSRGTDLYSISLQDSTTPNPICLMAKATSSQAWLWHRRLSHLNFDTINLLSKNNIVNGLPKLKFVKDHLCSSCELGKAKRKSFHTKTTPSSKRRLQLLHMDLCGPMRVESINGKKYVLVIVDDYSRYTWTHFLRSKDETPGVLIDFLTLVQRGLHAQVTTVRTDKGMEFLNKTLHAYFAKEGIRHETSTTRTPEQNGVVERRNRTLVEAARTMLSAAKVPLFFWAEAIAIACFTQNSSLVIPRHEKTPYHIINAQKPSVKFFHIFGSLCYIVKDGENLDKMKEKGDACIFVGYSTQSKAYRVFNKRTRMIVETIHVNFDELPQMASDHVSFDPGPQCSSTVLEQDSLSPVPTVTAPENIIQEETNIENAHFDDDEFINIFNTPVQEQGEISSRHVDSSNMHTFYQHHPFAQHWTKDHPLEQVIGNPSQSVRTRCQLETDGEMCMFALTVVSEPKPKNIKEAMAGFCMDLNHVEELISLFD
ncbi:putative ribonuclease H-like domain-containing protein [Tanacetum coccineum]